MLFSSQKWFCCVCGQEQFSKLTGNNFVGALCCSPRCYREFSWRRTLSIMGKDYYPDPDPWKENR